ncbi:MAG: hypothetical protein Q9209_003610 [Squamulea sp. 1 TL-2023]
MSRIKKTRKFAAVKRVIGQRDARLKRNQDKGEIEAKRKSKGDEVIREIPQVSSSLFFQYNTALTPPYNVLVDTNFLSHTVQNKLELLSTMMDCLYAKCIPIITSVSFTVIESLKEGEDVNADIVRNGRIRKVKITCSSAKGKYVIERLPDAPEK